MASVVSASVAVAARPQLAARRSAPSAALAARPQMRSLTAQMNTLSVRSSVVAMAAAADEPVEVEVETVEAEAPAAEVSTKEAIAVLRNVRGSPSKVRRVLDTIRGRTYEEALIILEYMPYRSCEPILKTLVSAASNAKHNYGMRKARLVVSTCYADMAPGLKRVKPRAQGRANKIVKQQSHITIKVQERVTA